MNECHLITLISLKNIYFASFGFLASGKYFASSSGASNNTPPPSFLHLFFISLHSSLVFPSPRSTILTSHRAFFSTLLFSLSPPLFDIYFLFTLPAPLRSSLFCRILGLFFFHLFTPCIPLTFSVQLALLFSPLMPRRITQLPSVHSLRNASKTNPLYRQVISLHPHFKHSHFIHPSLSMPRTTHPPVSPSIITATFYNQVSTVFPPYNLNHFTARNLLYFLLPVT